MSGIIKKFFGILILFVGIGFLLYPSIYDYIHSLQYINNINNYETVVETVEEDEYADIIQQVNDYNERLYSKSLNVLEPTNAEHEIYTTLLNFPPTGIIGYVNIPKINVSLPIYHGSDATSLAHGVGHIEGTSLPVPQSTTSHVGLTAHTGYPNERMFNDLVDLEIGDVFNVTVLKETLNYEVDNIVIVEPEEYEPLHYEIGENYCSLVTCYPYGINSHRLIVRGHLVEYAPDQNVASNPVELLSNTHNEIILIIGLTLAGLCIVYILNRYGLLSRYHAKIGFVSGVALLASVACLGAIVFSDYYNDPFIPVIAVCAIVVIFLLFSIIQYIIGRKYLKN